MSAPTLVEARQALADVLSDLPGVGRATTHQTKKDPRNGDAWVAVRELTPSRFGGVCNVQLVGFICLGPVAQVAEERVDALAVPALNAVTESIACFGVKVETVELNLSDSPTGSVLALLITLTTEVS